MMHLTPVALLLLLLLTTNLCIATKTTAATTLSPEEQRRSIVCLGMCSSIQKLCASDIANGEVAGRDLKEGILEEAACQLMCEADWDDKTFNCVSAADDCSQFFDEAPYCVETEDETPPTKPTTSIDTSCSAACKNYAKCAGYGEDATAQDQAYAFESCMEICNTWTPATRQCVASTPIRSASDCAAQTMCVMGSLKNMIPKNMPRR
ncbi:MAG: hypothetical protein PHI97_26830 [Desulfobulbus sp.]|nr:hypothetical protein [Desulfobulbus sp.]